MTITVEQIVDVFRQHGDLKQRKLIQRLKKSGVSTYPLVRSICIGDYPPSIKRWAMEALGTYGRRLTLPLLRSALQSPHMSVRLHAILGIDSLDDPSLAGYIRPLLKDESGGIRVNALTSVARMKPRWLRTAATNAIEDEKKYVRHLARQIIARDD